MKKLLSMTLEEIYLDYLNNFLRVSTMAEHYGVELEWMYELYRISSKMYHEVYESHKL